MAAFGILAALRERERSGVGQVVDISMFDGALSLAGDARRAPFRRRATVAARGELDAGRVAAPATARTRAPTARSHCGALEPKFWAALLRAASDRADLVEPVRHRPTVGAPRGRGGLRRLDARRVGRRSRTRTTAACEPVLDLDEALDSELVRAREVIVEVEQPGARRAGAAARPADQARPHARRPAPRPARRSASDTDEVLARGRLLRRRRSPR